MKAALVRSFGDVDCIRVEDVPAPRPGAGEAVVALRAASLNHLDLWVRKGRGTLKDGCLILGSDGAGVVVEVGAGVTNVKPGDEVVVVAGLSCGGCEACLRGEQSDCAAFTIMGMARHGTFAERVALPAVNLLPKPRGLSFEEGAALGVAAVTAWRMLMTRGGLRSGETVVIHGVGGGVALAALQFARLAGAEAIVTSSSDDKLARARKLGARHAINYRTEDVAARVLEVTGGRGADLVIDTVGAATWPLDVKLVRRGGRVVLCGVTTGATAPTDLRLLYWNEISLIGSTFGSHDDFRLMLRGVEANALKPVIDSIHPLDAVREATARMERGEQFGKIVLKVS